MTVALAAVPLAHAGHWYHVVLYLAPVALVAGGLWLADRRGARAERARGDQGGDEDARSAADERPADDAL